MTGRRRGRSRSRLLVAAAAVAVVLGAAGAAVAVMTVLGDEPTATPPASSPSPTPTQEPAWAPDDAEREEAVRLAAELSLPDLAGQLIVARHFANETSLALVQDKHFAGVMVTSPQILEVATDDPLSEVKAFNEQLRSAGDERGVPVLVPIDQEGGLVARLGAPMTVFPGFMTAGAALAGDPEAGADAVRAAARASGEELRSAGYTAVFAPVADLTVGAEDPIIGSRSPGSDAQAATGAVAAAVEGYGEAGILSSVKHFPGHGVTEDSHSSLPVLERTRAELEEQDLAPFAEAIDLGAPAIMTGHLDVPAIDDGVPASMSRAVVTGLLREEMGYDGVVVSDSLGMGPIMSRYKGGSAAVEALKAGSDLALMPADNDAAHEAVLEALESGDLPEEQARESAARVIAWQLHQEATPLADVEPGDGADAAQELTAAGVTVVTQPCEDDLEVTTATPVGDPVAVAAFRAAAAEAGLAIGNGTVVSFIGAGGAVTPGAVVVATDTPYALARSDAPVRIALFGSGEPAMRALVAVLTGEADAPGALPVEVPGVQPTRC